MNISATGGNSGNLSVMGSVGIGTSSPATLLDVRGSNGVIANFVGSSGKYGQIYSDANAAVFGASNSTSLGNNYLYINPSSSFQAFVTNGGESMRITSSGNVLIGTTTDNSTGAKLQVTGGISYQNIFNRQTASYTLVLSDADKLIEMNVGSANNLTVPASVFATGNQILLAQYGAGQTTIVAGAGVTIRSNGAKLKLNAQYSGATLIFLSGTECYCFGDIVA
jgi:hypothetical protein